MLVLTPEHQAAIETIDDMRKQGRMSRGEHIVLQRAFEADPYLPSPPPGTIVHFDDLDPPPDWRRVRLVLIILGGLLGLAVVVLGFLYWRGVHP